MALETLGRYEILGELGKGAMGLVYLARDPIIGRKLAIKTFNVPFSAGDEELEQFRARFLQEAKSAGILSHPNIVTIHDVIVSDDDVAVFIAMEYVKGTDLKQLMQRQERFEVPFVVDVVAQIADGLDYAHSKGVVHRDIKPANIILTPERQAKITDFGIAHLDTSNLTTEGQLLGTPNYISPEMIRGQPVDHRADIFSLGVMFYEMLTRKKPFSGPNLTAVTHRIVNEPFPPPDEIVPGLAPHLLRVLDRSLAKEPEGRYRRAGEMAADLRDPDAAPKATRSTGTFLIGEAVRQAAAQAPPEASAGGPAHREPIAAGTVSAGTVPDAQITAGAPAAGTVPGPQIVGPPVTAPAPVPAARRKASPVLWIVGAVLGLGLVAGILAVATMDRGGGAAVEQTSPEEEARERARPDVEAGRRLLAAGDPRGALAAFEKALAVVPDDREVRRLRRQAEEEARHLAGEEESPVGQGLAAARRALEEHDYPRAIRHGREVLDLEPNSAAARALVAEAEEGQRVKDQVRFGGEDPAAGPAAEEESAAAPAAKATLAIDFRSELGEEGRVTVTVYAEQEKVYQETVAAKRRSGATRLSGRCQVAAGAVKLRVYVTAKGLGRTKTTMVEADLPAGGISTLGISLSPEGRLTAQIR